MNNNQELKPHYIAIATHKYFKGDRDGAIEHLAMLLSLITSTKQQNREHAKKIIRQIAKEGEILSNAQVYGCDRTELRRLFNTYSHACDKWPLLIFAIYELATSDEGNWISLLYDLIDAIDIKQSGIFPKEWHEETTPNIDLPGMWDESDFKGGEC